MKVLYFSILTVLCLMLAGPSFAQQKGKSDQSGIKQMLNRQPEVVGEFCLDKQGQPNTVADACYQCTGDIADLPGLNMVCVSESAGANQVAVHQAKQQEAAVLVAEGNHLCADVETVAGTMPKTKQKERVVYQEPVDQHEPQY